MAKTVVFLSILYFFGPVKVIMGNLSFFLIAANSFKNWTFLFDYIIL